MLKQIIKPVLLVLLTCFTLSSFAQNDVDDEDYDEADKEADEYWAEDERKGLFIGIYVGAYFSNKYSARMYDGYGFDLDGNRLNFENSFLNRKINTELSNSAFGGDQIAEALNVSPGGWEFDETDMPVNMKYNIAFQFGLQARYHIGDQNAILFNLNFVKLSANGQFTIQILDPPPVGELYPEPIRTFGIRGTEQRIALQAGYQRILGTNDVFNWLVEAGIDVTFSKYETNSAQIEDLYIDLTTFYDQYGNNQLSARNLTGAGIGVFGGFGGQVEAGEKWVIQLVYSPFYQKVALSTSAQYGLHHSVGMRAIYQL